MATADLTDALTSAHLDITQDYHPSLEEMQEAFPDLYSQPGWFPTPAPLWQATTIASPSGVYGASNINYVPNHQAHNTIHPSAWSIPTTTNTVPPTNPIYSQATPIYYTPVDNATPTDVAPPIDHNAVLFPPTFEYPSSTQPEPPAVHGQQQVQDTQEGFSVAEPFQDFAEDHGEDDQPYEEIYAPLVGLGTPSNNDRHAVSSYPPTQDEGNHFYSYNSLPASSDDLLRYLHTLYRTLMSNPAVPSQEDAPFVQYARSEAIILCDTLADNATSTEAVTQSEVGSHPEVPLSLPFQYPVSTQPDAPPTHGQHQDTQGDILASFHNFAMGHNEESNAALVGPDIHLNNDQHDVSFHPPAQDQVVHYPDLSTHASSQNASVDIYHWLGGVVLETPDFSISQETLDYLHATCAPEHNDSQSTDAGYGAGPSGSGIAASASTSTQSSPSGSHPTSLQGHETSQQPSGAVTTVGTSNETPAQSSPSGSSLQGHETSQQPSGAVATAGTSNGKRKRAEGRSGDCPKVRRRVKTADAQEDAQEGAGPSTTKEKRRKKKKPVDGKFFCLLCKILQLECSPLSRRDALKRHVDKLHAFFRSLLEEPHCKNFGILEARHSDDCAILESLTIHCMRLQAAARAKGEEIKDKDLMALYPHLVQSLEQSQS